ncbi:MAG: hypothetical protein RR214_00235, partial [Synergistaceae bacterium]
AGDRIVSRKVDPYNNGTVDDEYSVDVNMNPYQEAQNALDKNKFTFDQQQAAFNNDLENRKLAADEWYKRGQLAIQGRRQPAQHKMELVPDVNGGMVAWNPYTGESRPTGFKMSPPPITYKDMAALLGVFNGGDSGSPDWGKISNDGKNKVDPIVESFKKALCIKAMQDMGIPTPDDGGNPMPPQPSIPKDKSKDEDVVTKQTVDSYVKQGYKREDVINELTRQGYIYKE